MCDNNCNGNGYPCPNCQKASPTVTQIDLQGFWQHTVFEHNVYQREVKYLHDRLKNRSERLAEMMAEINEVKGFILTWLKYQHYESDRDHIFWAIHKALESHGRHLATEQRSTFSDVQRLNAIEIKIDGQELALFADSIEDPKLKWAYELLQRGVELMPLEQLGKWKGIRTFLETIEVEDDQTKGEEHDEG